MDIKTVSSMLGHYDAGFTLRTYTHATRQMQDQAVAGYVVNAKKLGDLPTVMNLAGKPSFVSKTITLQS